MKGSNGASVGLFFKMLLRENCIDPQSVNYIQDLDGDMLGKLFLGGMGDYLIVDNLSARNLLSRDIKTSSPSSRKRSWVAVAYHGVYTTTSPAQEPQQCLTNNAVSVLR